VKNPIYQSNSLLDVDTMKPVYRLFLYLSYTAEPVFRLYRARGLISTL